MAEKAEIDVIVTEIYSKIVWAFEQVSHKIATDHKVFDKQNSQAAIHAINLMRDLILRDASNAAGTDSDPIQRGALEE